MNNKKIIFTFICLLIAMAAFVFIYKTIFKPSMQPSEIKNEVVLKAPSREPYEGCKWEEVNGIGLKFWGMRCSDMYMMTFDDTKTATLVKTTSGTVQRAYDYVTLYNINNGDINSVIPELKKSETWNDDDKCEFKASQNKNGVTKYTLMPTGDALVKFESESHEMPINSTCGGFGAGNSGIQYFEIHDSNPSKALFIWVGQDAPMIDEQTIEVLK